jgi:hypothetical protein
MAYTVQDFPSKKAAKEAIAASGGKGIPVYQPGPFGPDVKDGTHAFEGPHYPKPHRWYGSGVVRDGMLLSLK